MPKGKGPTGRGSRSSSTTAPRKRRRSTASHSRYLAIAGGIGFAVLAIAFLWQGGWLGKGGAATPGSTQSPPAAIEVAGPRIPPRPKWAAPDIASEEVARVAALRDESFDVAENLVRTLPGNPHALCLLGRVHHRFGNNEEAARLWDECLRLDPRFADAHFSSGQAALKAGDLEAAESHLRAALRIDPGWPDVPLPLGKALIGLGKFQEAVGVLEDFVSAHPSSSVEAWCRLGQAYHGLEDYRSAKRCHLEAIKLHPQSVDAAYGIAQAHQKLGEDEDAREYFDRFVELRVGEQYSLRREQPHLSDAQRLSETAASTRMTASRVAVLHGLLPAAEEHARRAAVLDPKHRESREMLCDIYVRTERLEEAIAVAKVLCDLTPDSPQHWHRLGILCSRQKKLVESESALRRVIELAPQEAAGYAALAQVQMVPGRNHEEAVELARKAVELNPTAAHQHVLATACWNIGDHAEARAALELALRLDPANPQYRQEYAQLTSPQLQRPEP